MEKVGKHRNIKHVTTENRKKFLASEPNYYKVLHRKFISNKNEKNSNTYK